MLLLIGFLQLKFYFLVQCCLCHRISVMLYLLAVFLYSNVMVDLLTCFLRIVGSTLR